MFEVHYLNCRLQTSTERFSIYASFFFPFILVCQVVWEGLADFGGAWDTEGWWDELKALIFPFPWKKKTK